MKIYNDYGLNDLLTEDAWMDVTSGQAFLCSRRQIFPFCWYC